MASPLLFLALLTFLPPSMASRTLSSLYEPPPTLLTYHKGPLLSSHIPVSILWYGNFTTPQKSIISDFLLSLTPLHPKPTSTAPALSKWFQTVDAYVRNAGKKPTHVTLSHQVSDADCSIGKSLTRAQLQQLAARASPDKGGLALVLTAADVTVDGFCMSSCGTHGSIGRSSSSAFVWVGNSAAQCPGQCAWPFHQPVHGPQGPALVAPNGDVGADGMVVNLAGLLAGAVTNPFGDGYFGGVAGAPVEVGTACTGVYGKGAYPGYGGEVLVDSGTGGSYNVEGENGRKYLVPALFDAATASCLTVV